MTPFSRWERELPKLIGDGRWAAVGTLRERRAIFDDFCRTSAEEHKRGKAERAKLGREGFLQLLAQAAAPGGRPVCVSWQLPCARWGFLTPPGIYFTACAPFGYTQATKVDFMKTQD